MICKPIQTINSIETNLISICFFSFSHFFFYFRFCVRFFQLFPWILLGPAAQWTNTTQTTILTHLRFLLCDGLIIFHRMARLKHQNCQRQRTQRNVAHIDTTKIITLWMPLGNDHIAVSIQNQDTKCPLLGITLICIKNHFNAHWNPSTTF